MSDDNTPDSGDEVSPSDDAAFEELVKNQSEMPDEGPVEIDTPWDGYEYIWKKFHAGDILVRGVFLAEYIDEEGKQNFSWMASPEMPPWTAIGLLQQALADVQAENVAIIFANIFKEAMEDKEDEEEDDDDIQ